LHGYEVRAPTGSKRRGAFLWGRME